MNLIEFSKIIGVSPTTVSHAINGKRPVKKETKKLILEKMIELGYTPNHIASALAGGQIKQIGLVFNSPTALTDTQAMNTASEILNYLKSKEYHVLLNVVNNESYDFDLLKIWINSKLVAGSIIVGTFFEENKLNQLFQLNHPCVLIENISINSRENFGVVTLDSKNSIYELVDKFVNLGHTKIGMIHRETEDVVYKYYIDRLKYHNIPIKENYFIYSEHSIEDSFTVSKRLLSQTDRPTAIFTRSDMLGFGLANAAKSLNISIPSELSIASHNDSPMCSLNSPSITTISFDNKELATNAVDMLFDIMKNSNNHEHKTINTSIIERESIDFCKKN